MTNYVWLVTSENENFMVKAIYKTQNEAEEAIIKNLKLRDDHYELLEKEEFYDFILFNIYDTYTGNIFTIDIEKMEVR